MGKEPASSWAPQKSILVPAPVQNGRSLTAVALFVVVVTVNLYQPFGNKVIVPDVLVNVPSLIALLTVPVERLKIARPRLVEAPSSMLIERAVTVPLTNTLPVYVVAVAVFVIDWKISAVPVVVTVSAVNEPLGAVALLGVTVAEVTVQLAAALRSSL